MPARLEAEILRSALARRVAKITSKGVENGSSTMPSAG
jgi:hypothetical protein